MAIRAKVTCISRLERPVNGARIDPASGCYREVEFQAVMGGANDENKSFSKYTPSLALKMTVTNPDADFEVGREYYIDFVRAPRAGDVE